MQSQTLAHLTELTYIKIKFQWTEVEQDDFDEIKRIKARDNLLTYTAFNETYKIYTNAIVFQLEAVISQKWKPITFYSRKPKVPQTRYTVIKK